MTPGLLVYCAQFGTTGPFVAQQYRTGLVKCRDSRISTFKVVHSAIAPILSEIFSVWGVAPTFSFEILYFRARILTV